MKKLIAILTIAVVLVGAVFAEGHSVMIHAEVKNVEPIFQLHLTGNVAEALTNSSATVFSASANYNTDFMTEQTARDTTFDLLTGGTVTAECYVNTTATNRTQSNTKYRISFSDGVFTVSRANATSTSTLIPVITTSLGTVVTGIKTNGISFASAPVGANAEAYASGATNKDVLVQFSGSRMAVAQDVVASAAYEYTGDETIVPGDYYATITMTITVEN